MKYYLKPNSKIMFKTKGGNKIIITRKTLIR